ncbi:pyridoxal-phosphate dependent enzyme [Phytomonospora sp. NPDC050363]|uniref:threonine ammonia-lyase n=1 Tax=Phytomonospora sp. NPDC050363 TaxID=3155642 RepID=UPI0033E75AD5
MRANRQGRPDPHSASYPSVSETGASESGAPRSERPGAPGYADVVAAAEWLAGRVVHTPLVRSRALDEHAGVRLWLKAENLQHGGSYKFRGAMRAVGRLAATGTAEGVIAQSTGNHGYAVAMAAAEHGLPAAIVLPVDAATTKVDLIAATGAEVHLVGTTVEERLDTVAKLHAVSGHTVIDAYDHPDVVCGQGTATLELLDDVAAAGGRLDAVVVPVGGGGGVAGACLAASREETPPRVYGVEPVGCDSLHRSLAAGTRVTVPPAPTLADGLRPSTVGELPFGILRDVIADVLLVDDQAIAHAFTQAVFSAKLLVEPSAAAALAGALALAAAGGVHDIGVLLTGGNVDAGSVSTILSTYQEVSA